MGEIPSWTGNESIDISDPSQGIYAQFQKNNLCTLLRGGHIIGLDRDFVWEQAKQELLYVPDKRYCDFIANDWKKGRVATCNCSPEATSN